jgi:hypothetical protein
MGGLILFGVIAGAMIVASIYVLFNEPDEEEE